MDGVRRLRANRKIEGKPCGWCEEALQLGDDTATCGVCEQHHHGKCWDGRSGCSTAGCQSAPLPRLEPARVAAAFGAPFPLADSVSASRAREVPAGYMACPDCHVAILLGTEVCPACKAITTPDGLYRGPTSVAAGAVPALVLGIIGLFLFGVILGPIAIAKGSSARKTVASDPRLTGSGLALAGIVLGVLDIIGWVTFIALKASA